MSNWGGRVAKTDLVVIVLGKSTVIEKKEISSRLLEGGVARRTRETERKTIEAHLNKGTILGSSKKHGWDGMTAGFGGSPPFWLARYRCWGKNLAIG